MKNTHPYGFWPSTISPEMLTQQSLRLSEPQILGEDIFWLETRPHEQGRNALVRMTALGMHDDLLPMPHSVRTRANEYGGGSYLVTDKYVFCVLDADQRVYAFNRDSEKLIPISPENSEVKTSWRYADFCWDALRQRLVCVREDHRGTERFERTEIVAITPESAHVEVLVTGADFYCNPRLSPDGNKLTYICWNHPLMPWDGTELHVASLNEDGNIASSEHIAGSENESVLQPLWSPSGELFFVSDRNNWWNLYRYNAQCTDAESPSPSEDSRAPYGKSHAELICDMPAEFATPQWTFGMRSYGFLNEHSILCCYSREGKWTLATIDLTTQTLANIGIDLRDIAGIFCDNNRACFLAGNAHQTSRLLYFRNNQISVLAQTSNASLLKEDISVAQAISFTTSDGETAHGFYYAPTNSKICGPDFTKPPLIVMCHGGPTGATESSFNMKIQFWTHRGFAVLDVNYRGSTGYGREYRDRLKKNWGITDVIDVCSGADYLVGRGLVDSEKLAIRGGSAGGYTVLAALAFKDTFKTGASLYGIGDLEALARDTHKFEAHYLDGLIGKYPEEIAIYKARSPINHVDKLNCPVIFLQGLKDKVVPPNQAEAMVGALQQKGIKTVYVTFEDEGHGFRQAASIAKAITAELDFYQSVFAEVPEAVGS